MMGFERIKNSRSKKTDLTAFIIWIIILIILNANLIFDNVFWTDELCSINLIHQSYWDGILETAADVHPPLYYLILKTVCQLFGYQGWVYHLASVIPFALVCVFATTGIRRIFGWIPAVMLTIMCGLSYVGTSYNIEVRMYSWAVFFMIWCYYEAYRVIQEGTTKHWILFTAAALCCAYTHYFSLLSAALLALGLYVVMLIRSKGRCIQNVFISIGIAVAGYLPWLMVLIRTFATMSEDYWIVDVPNLKACIKWSFGETSISTKLMMITTAIAVFAVILDLMAHVQKRKKSNISKTSEQTNMMDERDRSEVQTLQLSTIMMLLGLWTILGTIAAGYIVTALVRPFLQLRYLTQSIGMAAVCIGIAMQKCLQWSDRLLHRLCKIPCEQESTLVSTLKKGFAGILCLVVIFITVIFTKDGYRVIREEYITQKQHTQEALACIEEHQLNQNLILADHSRMALEYYDPNVIFHRYEEATFQQLLQEKVITQQIFEGEEVKSERITLYFEPDAMTKELEQTIENSGYQVKSLGIIYLAAETFDLYVIEKSNRK